MKKILCIEDDTDIAEVLEMALGDLYELMIMNQTKEVIKTMFAFTPDLILIDNFIGNVQAADVMKEIRTFDNFKEIPCILCSGHADIKSITQNISANAYLEKPFDLSELYAVINSVLLGKATV